MSSSPKPKFAPRGPRPPSALTKIERRAFAFAKEVRGVAVGIVDAAIEAAWARKTYPDILTQKAGESVDALAVRQCITKGAFAELRAACVKRGGPLTAQFLDLEREIDSFASQSGDYPTPTVNVLVRKGTHAGLGDQLNLIEAKATALRMKAAE
jgi:hypothetical protein